MELRIYDQNFNLMKINEDATSVTWRRRYNDAGEFQITLPATMENCMAFELERVVWIPGAVEAGVVEGRTMRQDHSQNTLTVTGRFLESYLDRRLIAGVQNFSSTIEDAARKIVGEMTPIPNLELGERLGLEDEVEFQAIYNNVLEYVAKLCKSGAYGFRIVPDFRGKKMTFQIYTGLDRTLMQRERGRVVFSEDFANITTAERTENSQLLKTVCFVGGEGEWRDKYVVVAGDESVSGLERREVFTDASDLTSNGLTIAQYKEVLRRRGVETLQQSGLASSFTCEVSPMGNFVYKKNYDLGDIVTVQKRGWNVSEDKRITEIEEVYEHGIPIVRPTFGDPLPESIDWSL